MESARANRLIHLHRAGNQKFIEFLGSLPSVTYELDADFALQMVSSNVHSLLGIRPEALHGSRALWHERLFPEDRIRLKARVNQIKSAELVSETHRIINDEGLPVWVSHSFWKIGSGSPVVVRGSMIPISADACTKSVDDGIISQFVHKIGNHFQLMNLLIGSFSRNGMPRSEMEALQETVERAVDFTRSFYNFCQRVQPSGVDLGQILNSTVETVAPLFAEKKVTLNVPLNSCPEGLLLNGDGSMLELAFTSILENALEATSNGNDVTVDLRSELRGTAAVSIGWIIITDSGCGMNKATLAKASAPFFSTKPNRNGLGLSMATRVVEMHGGLLTVSSEEGHGTQVNIVLPICRVAAD